MGTIGYHRGAKPVRPGQRRAGSEDRGTSDDCDAALAARLAGGDRDALALLFHRYAPAAYGLAHLLCPDRAERVVGDVFVRLWRHREGLGSSGEELRSQLLASVRSVAFELTGDDPALEAPAPGEVVRRGGSDRNAVDEHALADLVSGTPASALLTLPATERDAIALALFGGQTSSQIAAIMRAPPDSVRGWLRAGLSRIDADRHGRPGDPAQP